jgi:diphosphomevalonate decarboxylase|tara:strand:- start:535 stop:1497 length:963 start_codon:yes stop_codon:yes gene_type:complete
MQAMARSHPNIALIKYWGKRDTTKNLPAVDSLSLTLGGLWTKMKIDLPLNLDRDELIINGVIDEPNLLRISQCLDLVMGKNRKFAKIISECNFPISAGLASSSSSFSALVVAANAAMKKEANTQLLAAQAGTISGSAARSILGGIVELNNISNTIRIKQLSNATRWPLSVVIAITDKNKKSISSSKAMNLSSRSSPFYSAWIKNQSPDMKEARLAVKNKDFDKLAAVSEYNCLKMHSVMWTTKPSVVYWNAATLNCMHAIRDLQQIGEPVFFTMDAGPQIKAVCLPESETRIIKRLTEIDGVVSIMKSGLGEAPTSSIDL